jgi:hypothetical protein
MTVEACQAYCTENNYALAGVEYSQEVSFKFSWIRAVLYWRFFSVIVPTPSRLHPLLDTLAAPWLALAMVQSSVGEVIGSTFSTTQHISIQGIHKL